MTAAGIAVLVLLALAMASAVLSALGLLLAEDALDRIHYASLAGMTTPVLVGAAGVIQEWPTPTALKVALVSLVLVGSSPVLAHVLGRAARVREHGRLDATDGDGTGAG